MARFKRLTYALRAIQSPTFTTGGTPAQPPAGSVLENFKRFYAKEVVPSYPRAADSLPGSLDDVNVHPFAAAYDAATGILVPLSARAQTNFAASGITATDLGHDSTNDASPRRGFQPARAVVSVVDPAATETTETSQITGVRYKTKKPDSYTFPFGQQNATTNTREKDAQDAIRTAVSAAANRSVSFRSEKW